jgi:hypothetical protein
MKFVLYLTLLFTLWLLASYGQFAFWFDETGIGVVFYGFGGGVFDMTDIDP